MSDKYCRSCGVQIADNTQYCQNCGAQLEGTVGDVQTAETKTIDSPWWVGVALLGIPITTTPVLALIDGGLVHWSIRLVTMISIVLLPVPLWLDIQKIRSQTVRNPASLIYLILCFVPGVNFLVPVIYLTWRYWKFGL